MTEGQQIGEIILGILNNLCEQQHYTNNVTLLCANGKIQVSSVVVAAIFTIFREILRSLAQPMLGQPVEIAFPELDSAELESLYQCLLKPSESLHLNISSTLLNFLKVNNGCTIPEFEVSSYYNIVNGHDDACDEDIKNDLINTIKLDPVVVEPISEPVVIQIMKRNIEKPSAEVYKYHKKEKHKTDKKVKHEKTLVRKKRVKKKCEICNMQIPKTKEHICDGNNKHACMICGKLLFQKSMIAHLNLIHGVDGKGNPLKGEFPCQICGQIFVSKLQVDHHMKGNHKEKTPCPECGVVVRQLYHHMRDQHSSDELKKHRCPDCGKGFYQAQKMEQHRMNVHIKAYPYHCRYGCHMKYNDMSNRNSHERKKHGGVFDKTVQIK